MVMKYEPENTNEIVTTDQTYKQIMVELSLKVGTKRGGRPIGLDWKTYVQIIHSLEYGLCPENLFTAGIIKRNAFYDYKRKSPTFSNAITRASLVTGNHALYAIAMAARYVPAHFEQVRRADGTIVEIFVPEKRPHLPSARWWLTHEKECRKRFNSKYVD